PEVAPRWEYSQGVFAIFVVLDVLALNLARGTIRLYLQRRWKAGYNIERVLVAGSGDLAQMVAETLLAHRELGYSVVGFVDNTTQKQVTGLPVLGGLEDTVAIAAAHQVDQ